MQRAEMERRLHQMRLRSRSDAHVIEITIPEQSACVGHLLRDLNLPGEVIITSIQRQEQSIIPRGDTVLQGGDHLTLLTTPDQVERVEAQLSQGKFDNTAPHYHELRLASHAPAVGRSVAELGLPVDALIVTLRRDGQVQAVHGDTILQEGDELIVLTSTNDFHETLLCLTGQSQM
jgi:Trk K+ transport system NAD-binding subunit